MKIIFQIFGSTIQVVGAMGMAFILLPSIHAVIFHGGKASLFSIGFIIIGTLISVIFMFLGYVITQHSIDEKPTYAKKQISDVFTILAIVGLIGILVAVFMPASVPVRAAEYRRHCGMGKMAQIGSALSVYSNNNRRPTRKFFSSEEYEFYPDPSGDKGLKMLHQDFLSNKEFFKCPKDRRVRKTFWERIFGSSSETEYSGFESDFIYLGGFHKQENPVVPILIDKIGNHEDYCNVIFSDGKPKYYEFKYATYEDLIDEIDKEKSYSKETVKKIEESLKKALKNNNADM